MPRIQKVLTRSIDDPVERYIEQEMYQVGGYTARFQARLFSVILGNQKQREINGGLVEIGVHHGRSFFVMALHRNDGEGCLAIDLFEDDEMYNSGPGGDGRMRAFRANQEKLDITLSDREVLQGSSLDLKPSDIIDRVGPVRFFSIDGGHRYEHVENDLALAAATAIDEAVIVIDDFATPVWPEVTYAAYDWFRGDGKQWAPFAVSEGKLLAARRSHCNSYKNSIRSSSLNSMVDAEADYFDDKVLSISRPLTEKARDALIRRVLRTNKAAPLFS